MNSTLVIRLQTTTEQHARMQQLQAAFAAVCNAVSPLAQRNACWNRVALHHLAYHPMRQQFPGMGSQMICNAVYSVSRACRLMYQHPQSPFNLQRLAGRPLPLLKFMPTSPVYFDRHTLSLKGGLASMYTMDGRMRFNLPLAPVDEQRFRTSKLREIVLFQRDGAFALSFQFGAEGEASEDLVVDTARAAAAEFPQYLMVLDTSADQDATPLWPTANMAPPALRPQAAAASLTASVPESQA
jgi:hypothetical protein